MRKLSCLFLYLLSMAFTGLVVVVVITIGIYRRIAQGLCQQASLSPSRNAVISCLKIMMRNLIISFQLHADYFEYLGVNSCFSSIDMN